MCLPVAGAGPRVGRLSRVTYLRQALLLLFSFSGCDLSVSSCYASRRRPSQTMTVSY